MAQHLFSGDASFSLPLADANWSELYALWLASGDRWIGTVRAAAATSPSQPYAASFWAREASGSAILCRTDNVNAALLQFAYTGSVQVGEISTNGTVTSYTTSSDARLKENVVAVGEIGAVIDAMQVRAFDWISDDSHCRAGFVAQELHEVAPEAVSVGDSGFSITKAWGVDHAKLVPLLVAEVQSLRRRVAALEAA